MILVGNQRGGARDLAQHLLKDENEHVDVHELRGFASNTLPEALNEAYAVSRGTRCKQFLFSLSLNPPQGENVRTEVFEGAIDRAEEKLGLSGQPRAIIFHEKEGRRHCHVVWSRIDTDSMRAVPLPYSKLRLRDVSRELYLENGWTMPRGLMNAKKRDPRNFNLAEWQQAKRQGRDPREIKSTFQDCWATSDTQATFANALSERGYILARGDRRGFVAIDHRGEPYAISKWVGIRTKDVRARLKDSKSLPSVDEARTQMARDMEANLIKLRERQDAALAARLSASRKQREGLIRQQRAERAALSEQIERRSQAEMHARQERFNKGLRGLLDRVTGRRKQIQERNERETYASHLRDQQKKDTLIFRQMHERRAFQERLRTQKAASTEKTKELRQDIADYREMKHGHQERLARLRSGRQCTERQSPSRDFER